MGEFRERQFGELTVRIDRQTCIASDALIVIDEDGNPVVP